MPQLLPTVSDLRHMTPRQRKAAAKAVRAVMDATDQFIDDVLADRRITPEQRDNARRAVWSVMRVADAHTTFAQDVRAEAEHLEAQLRTEPNWITAARREALLDAIR